MNLTDIQEIRALLGRHGFRFSRSMGQNFLVAGWVPERIAQAAGLDAATGVVEIGPGIGCLTAELARRARKVVSVELDRTLAPVLAETLADTDNVRVVYGDALKMDLAALAGTELAGLRSVVCANVPYNITSPLLTAFLEARCFDSVTVMIQREVARRLCAEAGTADYGALTVFVNWYARPEILFDVPPDCFIPQPKVTSSVVHLALRRTPPVQTADEAWFFRVVRAAFGQRRKTLANALSAGLEGFSKADIAAAIEQAGLPPLIRGEALDIPAFARLSDVLREI